MQREEPTNRIPHVIPYQGSKRKIAGKILEHIHFRPHTFFEPFAGSAAMTLAVAANDKADEFVIADRFEPLAELWLSIIHDYERLHDEYSKTWFDQLTDPSEQFRKIRTQFNTTKRPADLLYLVARCVKNSIRFNSQGEFNQSPDNRRLGMHPDKLLKEARHVSELLKGRTRVIAGDFRTALATATERDIVYMDPPWQGTSGKRDTRYAHTLDMTALIEEMERMTMKSIPFMLSFDGSCGERRYGESLPENLSLKRVDIHAGRSTQATLLGRQDETIEALYLSRTFLEETKS